MVVKGIDLRRGGVLGERVSVLADAWDEASPSGWQAGKQCCMHPQGEWKCFPSCAHLDIA